MGVNVPIFSKIRDYSAPPHLLSRRLKSSSGQARSASRRHARTGIRLACVPCYKSNVFIISDTLLDFISSSISVCTEMTDNKAVCRIDPLPNSHTLVRKDKNCQRTEDGFRQS